MVNSFNTLQPALRRLNSGARRVKQKSAVIKSNAAASI
jgi:hypothetical protein